MWGSVLCRTSAEYGCVCNDVGCFLDGPIVIVSEWVISIMWMADWFMGIELLKISRSWPVGLWVFQVCINSEVVEVRTEWVLPGLDYVQSFD